MCTDTGDRPPPVWLGRDQGGQDAASDRGRRRHRLSLGTARDRFHARHRAARSAAGDRGLMLGMVLGAMALPAPVALRGLPRLPWAWAVGGVFALAASCIVGVLVGPVHISAGTVARTLLGISVDPGQANILWSLRFPRVVLGVLVGGMLALAGAAYQ